MPTIRLPNNWDPRPYQLEAWKYLERGGKRACLVCHRRWGKDDLALHWTATSAFQKVAPYWHMLPKANQARKAIWNAVNPHTGHRRIDEAFPKALRKRTNDQEMFIEFVNGSTWQVVGSDNYDALVGAPPYGLVLSEWALADPNAWAYLAPILNENDGWALFIYTSRGRNHGYSTYKRALASDTWFADRQPASETGVFSDQILEEARRDLAQLYGDEIMAETMYEQEYECSFDAPVLGSYYGRQMREADEQKRVTHVPHEPTLPVHTAWDLGVGDSTAIWFAQFVAKEVRLIGYYEASGVGLDHYASKLQEMAREGRWVYGTHYLPHDAKVRELGTGKTRVETLESLNIGDLQLIPLMGVDDGINAARLTLPRCWFNLDTTERGVDALRQYHAEYDEKRKTLLSRPAHDWASHGADAFRYLATAYRQEAGLIKPPIGNANEVILPGLPALHQVRERI